MIVGVLAILKAGGVHLPLDPAYPKERLAFMLTDAQTPVLLTQQRLVHVLPPHDAQVILLDADWPSLAGECEENPTSGVVADNLGYVIYTSGSTGRPKGVGMSLRTLSNLIQWQNSISPLSAGGRTLQFTSFSFDVSVLEILSTLSSAGTLVIMPEEIRADMRALGRLLDTQRVQRLFMPFAALQHLAEESARAEQPGLHLEQVISTGEALHITQPVAAFFDRLRGCTLHNEYGPTETHFVTEFTLARDDPHRWPRLPSIGRCIANATVYILDERMQRVPIGVVGQLYAGGLAVARGYLLRPALTAERFVPDPFGDEPGARLYRTGDLARFMPDGTIEYLGRSDHQIKIRGFRIEPGEVEVVLSTHPSVQEAAVVAQRSERGDARLVVYVVLKDRALPVSSLRRFLLEQLPEYMVPSVYVTLDRLPLGATGKVDRLRLPAPEAVRPELEGDLVAPRSPLEQQLAEIWADVLVMDKVGVHDDFFALGGHSLLAVQVINRTREVFGVDVPLLALFETPTIAGLVPAIVAAQVEQSDQQDISEIMTEIDGLGPEELRQLLSDASSDDSPGNVT
jgi:amino acid adenylation domain-containing protein